MHGCNNYEGQGNFGVIDLHADTRLSVGNLMLNGEPASHAHRVFAHIPMKELFDKEWLRIYL
jgi:hypothetical protein